MSRPNFISEDDIARWSNNIENDPKIPALVLKYDIIREVCYAGLYLAEELDKLNCPNELITRIQFSAGRMSFGRDPWEVSLFILDKFKNNELQFEQDSSDMN